MSEISISPAVRTDWLRWHTFLEGEVDFSFRGSALHTKAHCARVLLLSLLLADRLGLSRPDREALAMAACFHDSRRQDDGLDTGHGLRGAEYYRSFCLEHPLPFDRRCFLIMACHDRSDALAFPALEREDPSTLQLCRIFKDADALDRFRLGPQGLDPSYLRTREALELTDFARDLVKRGPASMLGLDPEETG